MFQSSDNLNIDEGFLSDAFEIPNTNPESNKRNSDLLIEQPVKKICAKPLNTNTKNILSIIKFKSLSQSKTETELSHSVVPSKNSFTKSEICINNSILNDSKEKSRRIVQRKFPGPAGILPEEKQPNLNFKILEKCDITVNDKSLESDEIVCSQLSEDVFKKEPWLRMIRVWSTNKIILPNKYTISWTKSKAISKRLINQKSPFLAALIQTIDCSSKDPMMLLKDKTGEIQATLLHEVWEEHSDFLIPGSVIVLKQVGVLSTLKKHYLTITLNNLLCIYSEQVSNGINKIETIDIQKITAEELIKAIENIKKDFTVQRVLPETKTSLNSNPYFKAPNSKNSSKNSPQILNESKENLQSNLQKNIVNKFNFKKNTNDKKHISDTNNIAEEEIILTQVLDGVNTDLLFEDF